MRHLLYYLVVGMVAGLLSLFAVPTVSGMAPRPNRAALNLIKFPGDPTNVAATGEGAWLSRSPMPSAVCAARACEVDGLIYVVGGWRSQTVQAGIQIYDPATDTWQERRGDPKHREYFAASALDGLIYVVGGEHMDDEWLVGGRLTDLEVYDPRADLWSTLSAMPTPRSCLAACALNGLIYAIGGFGGQGGQTERPLSVVEVYNPVTNTWTTRAPMPAAVTYPYACAVDGTIYVFGGGSGASRGLVFAYNPATNQWTTRSSGLEVNKNPGAVEVIDGLIYLFDAEAVVVYDPRRSAFTLKKPMPTMRYDATSAAIDGRAYLFGGSSDLIDLTGMQDTEILAANEMFAPIPPPPVIATQPIAQAVTASGALALSVEAAAEFGDVTYQWRRNGIDIAGATDATLTLPCAQLCHAGSYTVVVSTAYASIVSEVATVSIETPTTGASRLLNLSTRGFCQNGDNVLITGFVVDGTGSKRVLIRTVGQSLGKDPFNLAGVLPNPRSVLRHWNGSAFDVIASNDNWRDSLNAADLEQVGAQLFAFALTDDRDAAILAELPAGRYSVVSDCASGGAGVALVELYDADGAANGARLSNISTRGFADVGDRVMIPGFVISGESALTLLLRVVGPTLAIAPFNLAETMADPKLDLYRRDGNGANTLLLSRDNWCDDLEEALRIDRVAAEVGAFPLEVGSKDAAMVVTLQPGVYTVVGSSADDGGTGVVLVEAFALP